MRDFRRLPPHLRGASRFERVFLLASLALLYLPFVVFLLSSPHPSPDVIRLGIITVILGVLSTGCTFAAKAYSARFRQPDRATYAFGSWRGHMRAIALAAILPICALILAIVIPPSSRMFEIVFPITLIGGITFLIVCFVGWLGRSPSA